MKKILVPYDGSEYSVRALAWAIAHRDSDNDEIHVVYVVPEPQAWQTHGLEVQAVEAQLRLHAKEVLTPAREELEKAQVQFHSHDLIGDIPIAIIDLAKKLPADQIVMGTHGHGNLLEIVLGSVAKKILHLAEVPVTLIK